MTGTDLSHLYSLRTEFTVVGLTGRTGSGCSTIANQICKGFVEEDYPNPYNPAFDLSHNSYRKYQIIHDYAKQNFGTYELISYRDVLTLFFIKNSLDDLIIFLKTNQVGDAIEKLKEKVLGIPSSNQNLNTNYSTTGEDTFAKEKKEVSSLFDSKITSDFTKEIEGIVDLEDRFQKLKEQFLEIDFNKIKDKDNENALRLFTFFFSADYKLFSSDIHSVLKLVSPSKHNVILQLITNNIRRSGQPYQSKDTDATNIFVIAELINTLIKAIRKVKDPLATKVVIDSLRNPIEVMFFKQRYSAFYLLAINRDNKIAASKLKQLYQDEYPVIEQILEQEYSGGKGKEFYKQYIRSCIEKADIHITYRTIEETQDENKVKTDNTSPYFSWQMQLLKYIALISHPGLVTPSPEERCMQLAYTAKYNSGCISRQVGAAITDESYSIKAIGWNNTPEGQVPCLLRKAESLLKASTETIEEQIALEKDIKRRQKADEKIDHAILAKVDNEISAFTLYEKTNNKFLHSFKENYAQQIETNQALLKGRNVCFCFKSLHNSCFDGKNQVHTRSLHAEESAFLQITKYGGTAMKNGKLFTTASPCELCAKKAYQLGIRVIYYVDPYPGISLEQILETGRNPPEVRLFNGAIGNAYHWLYEPFMAYKDELALILGHDIKDVTAQQKQEIKDLEFDKATLSKENAELKKKLEELKA